MTEKTMNIVEKESMRLTIFNLVNGPLKDQNKATAERMKAEYKTKYGEEYK